MKAHVSTFWILVIQNCSSLWLVWSMFPWEQDTLLQYLDYELIWFSIQWRHNERDGVSNHQPHDSLLHCLFSRRSKKTSKLLVTGLCEENSPVIGEFTVQRARNAENVSIWWRHHVDDMGPGCEASYCNNHCPYKSYFCYLSTQGIILRVFPIHAVQTLI